MDLSEDDYDELHLLFQAIRTGNASDVGSLASKKWQPLDHYDLDNLETHPLNQDDMSWIDNRWDDGTIVFHSILTFAIANSTAEIVRVLLNDFGLDPSAHLVSHDWYFECGDEGSPYETAEDTPMSIAIDLGKRDIVQMLLDFGANPDGHWQAVAGYDFHSTEEEQELISLLLRFGADVRTSVYEYLSGRHLDTEQLEYDTQSGNIVRRIEQVLPMLKAAGATLGAPRPEESALHIAGVHPALLRAVAKHFEPTPVNDAEFPPLLFSHCCPFTLNLLARFGHDTLARDPFGNTLLHRWAIQMRYDYEVRAIHEEVVRSFERIVEFGVPVDAKNDLGLTALHIASLGKSSAAVAKLLAAGADPNALNNEGQTPMYYALACQFAPSYSVEFGLSYEPYLDRDEDIDSVASQLLRAGARMNVRDKSGLRLLDIVSTAGVAVYEKLLAAAKDDQQSELCRLRKNQETMKTCLFKSQVDRVKVSNYYTASVHGPVVAVHRS